MIIALLDHPSHKGNFIEKFACLSTVGKCRWSSILDMDVDSSELMKNFSLVAGASFALLVKALAQGNNPFTSHQCDYFEVKFSSCWTVTNLQMVVGIPLGSVSKK